MSWASRRQTNIILGLIIVISLPILVWTYFTFKTEPTCFDQLQNGDEFGIDCGGSCARVCEADTISIVKRWERLLPSTMGATEEGVYDAVIYFENVNPTSYAIEVPYEVTIYDGDITLDAQSGTVTLEPNGTMPVIMRGLQAGIQDVTRIDTVVGEPQEWLRGNRIPRSLVFGQKQVVDNTTKAQIQAEIRNTDTKPIGDISLMVLVYGEFDNLINFSTTYIERLNAKSRDYVYFTWPQPFTEKIVRIEVVPLYDILNDLR